MAWAAQPRRSGRPGGLSGAREALTYGTAWVSLGYGENPVNDPGASKTRIKEHYMAAVHQIMDERRLQSHDPGYEVLPNATFDDVVQYTEWHAAGGFQRATSVDAYYRYDRYAAALNAGLGHDFSGRIAHVDIGCGAGLFSWAFLDWRGIAELSLVG